MSLLGEISKNSEALRYHAKTAEIAGQNLAHVNDETYARQRVLAREGVMYGSFGGLQTSGLEAGGLDHARSRMLDDRVIVETGQTSSLEAKKEILDLLQAAMGESLTNNSVNAGLDEDHDSILAPGSLSRALNDFFNSFHDLSVAPNDATTKQDILNKVKTLVNRFNETGENLDRIESDLNLTMERSVDDVNRLLSQIHEVNKQVRRFELQDKGKAVSYRDRRQALLEELAGYMNFTFEDDIDPTTNKVSGFLNLYVDSKDGRKINLLDPTGPKSVTNDWDQKLTLGTSLISRDLEIKNPELDANQIATISTQEASRMNPGGRNAVVQAKITPEGKLGRVEVLDGGTSYDDSDGPILLSLLPPIPLIGETDANPAAVVPQQAVADPNALPAGQPFDEGNEISAVTGGATQLGALASTSVPSVERKEGEVFYFENAEGNLSLWQALENTGSSSTPLNSDQFMEITDWPNGKVDETKRKFSDLESFVKGDQIYYEGKYYQASEDAGALLQNISDASLENPDVQITNRNFSANDVFEYDGNYYQALSPLVKGLDLSAVQNREKGEIIQLNSENLVGVSGNVLLIGDVLPENGPGFASKNLPLVDGDELLKGDVLSVNDSYFMFLNDEVGTLDSNNPLHLKYLSGDFNPESSSEFVKLNAWIDSSAQVLDQTQTELELQIGEVYFHQDKFFIVNDAPYNSDTDVYHINFTDAESVASFNPFDEKWSEYIYEFTPQAADQNIVPDANNLDSLKFVRKAAPTGHNISDYGSWEELNLGIAEAVIRGGEIKDFKIINEGNGLPSENSIFLEGDSAGTGTELSLETGAIAGYQDAKLNALDKFRVGLNELVTDFVSQVNGIYNPTDEPGGYLFGFDAFLSRPVMGPNTFIEETYGLFGKEGNGELKLFEEEVNMTLPYAEGDTFTIVQSSNILPNELEQGWDLDNSGIAWFREGDNFGLQIEDVGVQSNFYASARRMQHTTIDYDSTYPGEDRLLTPDSPNNDDGRFWLRGYEDIPFRIEDGSQMYVQGDNFKFDAVLSNEWNLATALRVDDGLNAENIKSSEDLPEGSNDTAFEISKVGDGKFTEMISVINADLGNEMADLNDNLDHQKSIQNLLLDQRRAVSSVSIDEEVADLMQFQRSFQASSRVLNTLDKMLELVVMGLVK
ncbi:MAG: hypothetical protein CMI24_07075 [Opitutae bacterium]|nr:hypothetical protein [Opitutae bacterium]